MPQRTIPIVAAGVLLIAIAFGVTRLLGPHGPVAPDFTLTDQSGNAFALSSERGHPVALFFGYAHCPDICPTTLAALAQAKRKLDPAERFAVVFVTVDPRRDTPAVLGRYLRLFDPSFIGLSGTDAQLEPVYAAYHVYHQDLPNQGSAAGYLVAHSSAVDFIGGDGRIRAVGDWSDTPDQLAADMKAAS
jgi:protein SCO1/2